MSTPIVKPTPQVHLRWVDLGDGVYQSIHGITVDDKRRNRLPAREVPLYTRRRAKRIVVYAPLPDDEGEDTDDDE